ncbi:MAG: transcriptional repressor NsrR [Chthonomonadaceae bacterium]|nr:transcriptional repressor NsrR [Chthonomonadaceae bacterium]
MISQTAEYALRAVAQLCSRPGEAQTTQQIADATHVPMPYLSKVLQALARAGLIHSQRGLHGGITLLRQPETLTVYDVVQAVDPMQRIMTCPLGLEAHGTHLCPLHRRLDDALLLVEQAFRDSTIADLLREPSTSKPLCPFPIELPNK